MVDWLKPIRRAISLELRPSLCKATITLFFLGVNSTPFAIVISDFHDLRLHLNKVENKEIHSDKGFFDNIDKEDKDNKGNTVPLCSQGMHFHEETQRTA